jgi:hypothetical protein
MFCFCYAALFEIMSASVMDAEYPMNHWAIRSLFHVNKFMCINREGVTVLVRFLTHLINPSQWNTGLSQESFITPYVVSEVVQQK